MAFQCWWRNDFQGRRICTVSCLWTLRYRKAQCHRVLRRSKFNKTWNMIVGCSPPYPALKKAPEQSPTSEASNKACVPPPNRDFVELPFGRRKAERLKVDTRSGEKTSHTSGNENCQSSVLTRPLGEGFSCQRGGEAAKPLQR